MDLQLIQGTSLTRFLPDATRNPDIDLVHVGYRLATLSALPASVPVSRIRLADAGFYFWGQNDEVTCYRCKARHSGWTREDNPLEIHRRLSPQCEHMLQRYMERPAVASHSNAAGGCSIGSTENGVALNTPPNRASMTGNRSDTSFSAITGARSNGINVSRSASNDSNDAAKAAGSNNGGATHGATGGSESRIPSTALLVSDRTNASRRLSNENASISNSSPEPRPQFSGASLELALAVYPMYQDMASRRRTFTNWNDSQAPPLDQVILSGMFYAGYADCVRCFYCGVGLKHWVVTDDVWDEHVRWRPGCEYLRAIKGDQFIKDTQRRLGIEEAGGAQEAPSNHRSSQTVSQRQQSTTSISSHATTSAVSFNRTTATATATSDRQPSSASATSAAPDGADCTPATGSTSASQAFNSSSSTTTTTSSVGGVVAAMRSPGATAATPPAPAGRSQYSDQEDGGGGSQAGAGLRDVSSAGEDLERLSQLQEENRLLSSVFQCKICHQAAIDTILMPCGHLVVCETCARSITSCPLCHDTIRATARVLTE